jgi:uncharacterized membrane protein
MGWKAGCSGLLLLVGYPLASRYALSHGWNGAWLATLLPVLIYCILLVSFASTLRPGGVPLISRFAQMEQGELSSELHTYTRRLTVIWCVFFAGMAALALALAAWAPVHIWSLHTFFFSYLLIAMLFLGEYIYRRWRYPHYRHANPWQLLRNIRHHGLR